MEELISVIVPVYMVEKYLERCVESICRQTYKNIEIILVDDGSPDRSGALCEELKKRDKRIRVIHQQNKGLSGARNTGIEAACGAYYAFIDSDDTVDARFLEFLYLACTKANAQISVCQINRGIEPSENPLFEKAAYADVDIQIMSGTAALYQMYETDRYIEYIVTWNKLYHSSLFTKVSFPLGKIHEDEATVYKLLFQANKVAVFPFPLYNYAVTENSIMTSPFSINRLDILEALSQRSEYFMEYGEKKLAVYSQKRYYNAMILLWIKMKGGKSRYEMQAKKLKKQIYAYWPIILRMPYTSFAQKGWMIFKGAWPGLAAKIRNFQYGI